ncbi:MAG: hypothetical protein WDZ31_13055, partial [Phycisphaeraceae bacterium]
MMQRIHAILPWVVAVAAVAALALLVVQAQRGAAGDPGAYHLERFGTIPVSADGRVKPMDTVARTSLMLLSGRQSLEIDGEPQPAIRWLLDVMAQREQAEQYPVFRIDHPDVRAMLHEEEPTENRFSFAQIMPHWQGIVEQAQRVSDVPSRQRNAYQRNVLHLYQQVSVYMNLHTRRAPYMIPPSPTNDEWMPFEQAVQEAQATGRTHPAVTAYMTIFLAYHHQQPAQFNEAVAEYRTLFTERAPAASRKANFEVFFSAFRPFYHATTLYVAVFLLAAGSLLLRGTTGSVWAGTLAQMALALLVVTFCLHTFGLASRVYLQGRPPVTNLYSSAVFVGWGTVLLAILVEGFHRLGLATLGAGVVGAVTLIIAHNLAGDGDTMEMMQAVLDSNF